MASSEVDLFRFSQNDPRLDFASVSTVNCSRLAEALEGNTNVRSLEVKLFIRDSRTEEVIARWSAFCRVIQRLTSLKSVSVSYCGSRHDEDNYVLMSLLLQHTQQITELLVDCSELPLRGPFFRHLADGIADHGALEVFYLEDFRLFPAEPSLIVFMATLESISKLRRVLLAPCFDIGDLDDFDFNPMVGAPYLLRLLSLPSLEELELKYFGFRDELAVAMREGLSSTTSNLRRLSVDECEMTVECLGSLIQGVANHSFVKNLKLDAIRIRGYNRGSTVNLLDPLSRNTSLNSLLISFRGLAENGQWPHLHFLRENTFLKHLTIKDSRLTRESYASLFLALRTNSFLESLVLWECSGEHDEIDALAAMIRDNTCLKRVCVHDHAFPGVKLVELVPALVQNKTLEHLDISPSSSARSSRLNNVRSEETAAFVRGVLKGSTGLKTLKVGSCCPEHMESLVPIMAQNHHLESLAFHLSSSSPEKASLASAIQVIGTLNKFGRRYLVERGPECKVAGVALLSAVSDNLDCLFYHLRENPGLCKGGGKKKKQARIWCCSFFL